jgi:putative flippase GtrA
VSVVESALRRIRGAYDLHGEKLRYLLVGVWNTAFSIVLFNIILFAFGHGLYLVWFWASWVVAVIHSTATMKYVVFRKPGHFVRQLGRAYLIYLPAQGLSTAILWATVQLAHTPVPVGQLITIAVSTVFSYIGHKYFTFRLPLEVGEVPLEDLMEVSADRER